MQSRPLAGKQPTAASEYDDSAITARVTTLEDAGFLTSSTGVKLAGTNTIDSSNTFRGTTMYNNETQTNNVYFAQGCKIGGLLSYVELTTNETNDKLIVGGTDILVNGNATGIDQRLHNLHETLYQFDTPTDYLLTASTTMSTTDNSTTLFSSDTLFTVDGSATTTALPDGVYAVYVQQIPLTGSGVAHSTIQSDGSSAVM